VGIFERLFGRKSGNSQTSALPSKPKIRTSGKSRAYIMGRDFMEEYIERRGTVYRSDLKISDVAAWKAIKAESKEVQAEICYYAAAHILGVDRVKDRLGNKELNETGWATNSAEMKLASTLLRSKLPFTEAQLAGMLLGCAKRRSFDWETPIRSVLSAVERHLGADSPQGELRAALNKVIKKSTKHQRYSDTEAVRKIKSRIQSLLNEDARGQAFIIPEGEFSKAVTPDLKAMVDAERENWFALLTHAFTANGSKPSGAWLKTAAPLIEVIGKKRFSSQLTKWTAQIKPDPQAPDPGLDVLKGLVWSAAIAPSDETALAIGRLAETSYVKVAGIGARSKKLGNACCIALMNMTENKTAVAELVRLRGKIKYPSVKADIQKKLDEIAEKKGVTTDELEDASLPTFGFENGEYSETLGDFSATIALSAQKAILGWTDKAGKARKTIPTDIRNNHKADLTRLRQLTKDMSALMSGQTQAIEQSYINDRSWDFASWKTQYWEHPLRVNLTQSLIWYITDGTKSHSVLPTEDGLSTRDGKIISPSDAAAVRLWHPLFEDADTIVAWRRKIEGLGLTQPFKQAHREVYVVTDAERNTEIYSNRFAAHIIRQHQFKALCDAKQWSYSLQGMWDSWNLPQKHIRAFGIMADFHVEIISEDNHSNAWIPLYLTTDQVRFSSVDQEQMRMEDVPPIVFSEIMRDVDLFVSVTSVANDPTWADGGPNGRFANYWTSHAFGDLGQTAKMRKELIAGILPKLAIADKCEITDKFLTVQGKRNTYKIHFGSGNIMIMPGNRYLCILKSPKARQADKIHLPFAGDGLLSVILSKAFLLVNDDKITDKTILSQL
jgi:hypothetical protein